MRRGERDDGFVAAAGRDLALDDVRRRCEPRPDHGQRLLENLAHLGGNAGEREHREVPVGREHAGCGPDGVVDGLRAVGQDGHLPARHGERAVIHRARSRQLRVAPRDEGERRRMLDERNSDRCGHPRQRAVVERRTEAARRDDERRATLAGIADLARHDRRVVVDRDDALDPCAECSEPSCDPCRVGIHRATGEELPADGHDLGARARFGRHTALGRRAGARPDVRRGGARVPGCPVAPCGGAR